MYENNSGHHQKIAGRGYRLAKALVEEPQGNHLIRR
jgi:hypothetical protein